MQKLIVHKSIKAKTQYKNVHAIFELGENILDIYKFHNNYITKMMESIRQNIFISIYNKFIRKRTTMMTKGIFYRTY
jgi:hypothetical protein